MPTSQTMNYQFYSDGYLLFTLEDPVEYDTATPYRYAVSKFVELAEQLKQGQSITVVGRSDGKKTTVLHTVAELMSWISANFNGFDQFVRERIR